MNKPIFSPHKRGKSPTPSVTRKSGKSKTTILSKSQFSFITLFKSSTKTFQNPEYRDYMEDITLTQHGFMKDANKHIFGVFDGHGGDESAKMCQELFPEIFSLLTKQSPFNVEQNLKKSFQKLDEEAKKRKYKNLGNTATVIYITNKTLFCANVGDSSCVIVFNDNAKKVSFDDKASEPSEIKRIESCGGKVIDDRLNGVLAISRGIGDLDMKDKGLSCEPHVYKTLIDETTDYCVIASDGIWDVIEPIDVYKICKRDNNPDIIVESIVDEAIERGSEDNISCIVICLKEGKK